MAVFQITLFYPNLQEHQATVRKIRQDVELFSGNNYRVLSAGEQVCALGFETGVSPEQLRDAFQKYGTEHFLFLLTEISAPVAGYLTPDTWRWLDSRLHRKLRPS